MLPRHCKQVWFVAVLSLVLLIGAMAVHLHYLNRSVGGNKLFAGVDIIGLDKITLQNARQTVTLQKDENLWRVKEADNYYADFNLMRSLLANIENLRLKQKYEATSENLDIFKLHNPGDKLNSADAGTVLSLFDASGKKLRQIIIGGRDTMDNQVVRLSDKNDIFAVDGIFTLPRELSSWTKQPLIHYNGLEISAFEENDERIERYREGAPFMRLDVKRPYLRMELVRILDMLTDLKYDKVLSSQEFDDMRYRQTKTLSVTSFDGLVTELKLLTDFDEYWVQIRLSTTTLPSVKVNDYIQNNGFLYEDWWFRLPADTGRALFQFKL